MESNPAPSLGSWPERFQVNGCERFRRSGGVPEPLWTAAAGGDCAMNVPGTRCATVREVVVALVGLLDPQGGCDRQAPFEPVPGAASDPWRRGVDSPAGRSRDPGRYSPTPSSFFFAPFSWRSHNRWLLRPWKGGQRRSPAHVAAVEAAPFACARVLAAIGNRAVAATSCYAELSTQSGRSKACG
jgi:hypothetical protein